MSQRHRLVHAAITLSLSLAAAACARHPMFGDGGYDVAVIDGDAVSQCTAGQWQCVSPTQARQCDGQGGYSQMTDCSTTGSVCSPGVGCTVCQARQSRCDPATPDHTQVCAADGSAWTDGATCDPTAGEHCVEGHCANPCNGLGNTYLGCDYWPTTTANGAILPSFDFAAVVSNTQTYPVDVVVEGGGLTSSIMRTVAPGAVEVFRLPWVTNLSENTGACCGPPFNNSGPQCAARSTSAPNGAYHLHSNGPIAAYQFNPLEFEQGGNYSFTSDASLLLPQNVLGQRYYVFAYGNDGPPFAPLTDRCDVTSIRGGFVAIVGAQDTGTNMVLVRATTAIWDPADSTHTLPAGDYMYTIGRGEVLQIVSQGWNADLTGTYVEASGPVAVFSGHECTAIPHDRPACDHLEEQLFPTTAWGHSYAVSPFHFHTTGTEMSVIRVMSQRDGATLTFDGIPAPAACAMPLMHGQFCEFQTDQGFTVTGSEAISVAEYMHGLGDIPECMCAGNTCPGLPQCVGDPAMVLVPPTDQFRSSYRFLVPDSYTQNFLNVVSAPGAQIMLDGTVISGPSIPTGATLVTHTLSVTPGAHEIHGATDADRFEITVYGVAPYTSYAYPGGLDLAPITPG